VSSKFELPNDYRPSEGEEYMGPMQREYFKKKLSDWKKELLEESTRTLSYLQEETLKEADPNDRAVAENDTSLELRTRDRYRKLIDKIDAALGRIDNGEYGYCAETGDEIGIKRLEARPVATLTVEAQERHENYERQHSDDE